MQFIRAVPRATELDHDALVAACRTGDRRALETVFQRHAPMLSAFLRRLVHTAADAEDLLQVTLITAIRAFPRYRGDAPLDRWLVGIAVRVVRDHFRRPELRRRAPLESAPETALVATEPDPEVRADRQRLAMRLRLHLDRLDADKRLAFVLHVLEGHPVEDVAHMTGATRMATKSRIFWARRQLRRRIERDPGLVDMLGRREGHA